VLQGLASVTLSLE